MECNLYCLTQLAKTCGLLLEHKKKKCPKKCPKKHKCPTTVAPSTTTPSTTVPTTAVPTTAGPPECCVPFRLPILNEGSISQDAQNPSVLQFGEDLYGNVTLGGQPTTEFTCSSLDRITIFLGQEGITAKLVQVGDQVCGEASVSQGMITITACDQCTGVDQAYFVTLVSGPDADFPAFLDGVCKPISSVCNCCVEATKGPTDPIPVGMRFPIFWFSEGCVVQDVSNVIACSDGGTLENLTMVITSSMPATLTFVLKEVGEGGCLIEVKVDATPDADYVVSFNTCDCDATINVWELILTSTGQVATDVIATSISAICKPQPG